MRGVYHLFHERRWHEAGSPARASFRSDQPSSQRLPFRRTALSFLWLLSLGAHYSNKIGKWCKGFIVLFAPVLGFLFGSSAASNAIPMVRAMASGVETQMVFTVAGYKRSVDRQCSNPITLEGLPFLSGRLCGFSEDLGNSLQIGDEVMVFGRGTADGLFVKFAARLKPIENDASSGLAE